VERRGVPHAEVNGMSAIFGERLMFAQRNGPEVRLLVHGDEFYARHETDDGYTAVYDAPRGQWCYAVLVGGAFTSSGKPVGAGAPPGVPRHLHEDSAVRRGRRAARRAVVRREPDPLGGSGASFVVGPSRGLLSGRQLSVGAVRGLTILVNFADVQSTVTQADVSSLLNDANYTRNGNFSSAREYFRLVSNGKLDYTNDVVGPVRLSRNREYYLEHLLVEEALDLAVAQGVDLRRYDSRHEGIVDALNIMYAGQTQYLGELWPHNSTINLQRNGVRTNLYLLTSMGRNADELSIGTFCHENGHLLCRFPDMYDYGNRDGDTGQSAGIGAYCLMGSGNHLNFGRTPSPVCGYLRDLAGWCDTAIVLDEPGEYEARHADYGTVIKMPTDKPNEYFVVENRSKLGLDQSLPASGLAVYHCDTLGSNELQDGSPSRHYQCALLQADGHLDLEHDVNQGDGTDLFAASSGVVLSATTLPSSRRWDGADSGLVLSALGAPGTTIKFTAGEASTGGVVRGSASPAARIPDNTPAGISSRIDLAGAGNARRIKVALDITHTYVGDLVVELTNPAGTTAVLHNRTGGSAHDLTRTYDSAETGALAPLVAQAIQGSWTLRVRDLDRRDEGVLNRWTLEVEADAAPRSVHGEASPNLTIPDADPIGVSSLVALAGSGSIRRIKASIEIQHTYIGDLRVELVSPSGRRAVLHAQLGGSDDDLAATYDSAAPSSALASFAGQPIAGSWVLRVSDLVGQDVGKLRKWSIDAEVV
jgi:M6 family metalloprotease-like protein